MSKYTGPIEVANGGTVPASASTNAVKGVLVHSCNHVATVHNFKGPKKKHLMYLNCPHCGNVQPKGDAGQLEIKSQMHPTLEALYAAESASIDTTEKEEPETDSQPLETNESAVSSEINTHVLDTIEQPEQTEPEAVTKVIESLPEQPKVEQVAKPQDKKVQPLKVVACAILGGIFGGLLGTA
ncbi:hypothetical protein JL49_09075 [Pseudoalteromonas luteoviolacea]|nr:hypothetical protein JL49_09075 [Pseudoalteromonas luteoviolacea]